MLRLVWARVSTLRDNRRLVEKILQLEQAGRRARRDIWRCVFYRFRSPANLRGNVNKIQLVDGRVWAVATAEGRRHLNFGDNWRRDYTIVIAG